MVPISGDGVEEERSPLGVAAFAYRNQLLMRFDLTHQKLETDVSDESPVLSSSVSVTEDGDAEQSASIFKFTEI